MVTFSPVNQLQDAERHRALIQQLMASGENAGPIASGITNFGTALIDALAGNREMKAREALIEEGKQRDQQFLDASQGLQRGTMPEAPAGMDQSLTGPAQALQQGTMGRELSPEEQQRQLEAVAMQYPEGHPLREQAMARAWEQAFPKPKDPITLGANERLLHPETYDPLVDAQPQPQSTLGKVAHDLNYDLSTPEGLQAATQAIQATNPKPPQLTLNQEVEKRDAMLVAEFRHEDLKKISETRQQAQEALQGLNLISSLFDMDLETGPTELTIAKWREVPWLAPFADAWAGAVGIDAKQTVLFAAMESLSKQATLAETSAGVLTNRKIEFSDDITPTPGAPTAVNRARLEIQRARMRTVERGLAERARYLRDRDNDPYGVDDHMAAWAEQNDPLTDELLARAGVDVGGGGGGLTPGSGAVRLKYNPATGMLE